MLHRAPAWEPLKNAATSLQQQRLVDLFSAHESRHADWQREACGLQLDFSHQLMNSDVLARLLDLPESQQVMSRFQAMVSGEVINTTEQRGVLHTALRDTTSTPIRYRGQDIKPLILDELACMESIAEDLTHITDVVNLGIGGSDLGPRLVTQALSTQSPAKCRTHFLADTNPALFQQTFGALNPETTLVIISSKSFTTQETLHNARKALDWIANPHHVYAITAHPHLAIEFGVLTTNILKIWDWVGGRFSVWSAIGFPIVLAQGMPAFREFLAGAHAMDHHLMTADFDHNCPILLALIGIWNINFLGAQSLAIIPYPYGLREFPYFVQQLDMESNGKIFTADGQRVPYATAPVIWGTGGLHAQHTYFQALYQGGHPVPVDFVTERESPIQHSPALAGLKNTDRFTDTPHNIISLERISPYHLGALLALYEHKIAAQGFLWGINSFDQPGIELGKRLASGSELI